VDRRGFIGTVAGGLVAVPFTAKAQTGAKPPRIGYLIAGSFESRDSRPEDLRRGLREHGYVEGQNIIIEYRAAEGRLERLPDLATELVRLKVDVIVAASTPVARAVRQATTTIPIVAPALGDPVGDGFVASLARPGGNITGSTFLGPGLVPKRLELLKEVVPRASRVATLWHPGAFGEPTTREMFKETGAVAQALKVQLIPVGVRTSDELDRAFSTMTKEHAGALVTFPSPMFYYERRRLVGLAASHRLPSMFNATEFVELGGLVAYGASIPDLNRRAGTYVDKILKGTSPGDLPIEQPTKFELVINLKTAKALGLTIPPSLLQRADQVIE
jgi:putative tryptophan/tyrosine transport system substrate-binding protein